MKKLILILCLSLLPPLGAVELPKAIEATLLSHLMTVTQIREGEAKLAVVDSVVLIGELENKSLVDIQMGFNGETKAEEGKTKSANFIVGGFFKWGTLLRPYARFPEHWKLLNSLEYGSSLYYDTREKIWQGTYFQFGLAFGLNPK